MTIEKLQYLEKWLELSFLEEREKNRSENSDAAQKFKIQTDGYYIPSSLPSQKKFEFDLESYEELSLALNNLPQNFNNNPSIYLKFSQLFESETQAEILLELLNIGLNFSICHQKRRTSISGTL
jgi:hypothetical protein